MDLNASRLHAAFAVDTTAAGVISPSRHHWPSGRPQHQATAAPGQRYSDDASRPKHRQ